MSDVSTLIQQTRLKKGLSVEEVANIIKIRSKYLKAIEQNSNSSDIPSPVYMLGYLRIYADFLGLNGNQIIENLKLNPNENADLVLQNDIFIDDNRPGLFKILLSALLVVLIYSFWSRWSNNSDRWSKLDEYKASIIKDTSHKNSSIAADLLINKK